MHLCLQTYDILEQICQELRSSDSLDALAKLAATCHDFMDPALDELWHTIPTLEPLIRCLPQDAWTIKNTRYHPLITLTRQTTLADWERCKFYAPRIRQYGSSGLDTTSSKPGKLKGSIPTDRTVYKALKPIPISNPSLNPNPNPSLISLAQTQTQSLLTLPNLQTCCLQPYSPLTPIPHFRPFLSPNLRSLEFTSPTYDPEEILPGILREVARASPLLRSLRIEGVSVIPPLHVAFMHDHDGPGSESESETETSLGSRNGNGGFGINRTLSNMLQSLDQLTSLICPLISFPPAAIIHLATRSKIRALHIKNPVSSFIEVLEPIFNPYPYSYSYSSTSTSTSTSTSISNSVLTSTSRSIPCFSHLENLHIECFNGLSECSQLLSMIDNIHDFKELEVGRNNGIPNIDELQEFLEGIGRLVLNKKLRSLYIHQDLNVGFTSSTTTTSSPITNPSSSNANTITINQLLPLLTFPSLSELNLIIDIAYSFSNSDLEIIAKSWPELTALQFGFPGCGWKVKSNVGFRKGLKGFGRWCKKLRILNVVFEVDFGDGDNGGDGEDREEEEREEEAEEGKYRCESLQFLDVGNSTYPYHPINEGSTSTSNSTTSNPNDKTITKISTFLLTLFPNLKCVYGPDIVVSPDWQKKWMEVSKKVNELRELRRIQEVVSSSTATSDNAIAVGGSNNMEVLSVRKASM